MERSGSADVRPSKSQTVPSQLEVQAAVGAWSGATVRSTIDQVVAVAFAVSAVAVRPPYDPVGTAPPESANVLQMCPEDVPQPALRGVTPAGRMKPVVAADLSAQYDSTHEHAGASTVGVVWEARFTVSARSAWT